MLRFGLLVCVCLKNYFSWVVRFFLLLGPRAHLVFYMVRFSIRLPHKIAGLNKFF